MSAKEKGGKEIVGDDERANDKETMMELHARRVFLLECCVASLMLHWWWCVNFSMVQKLYGYIAARPLLWSSAAEQT